MEHHVAFNADDIFYCALFLRSVFREGWRNHCYV